MFIKKPWRIEVFKYIAGIIDHKNQKSIIVNGVEDHVDIFVGIKPSTQEAHHKKKTFKDEYLEFLRKFEIEYDERYLFEWIE